MAAKSYLDVGSDCLACACEGHDDIRLFYCVSAFVGFAVGGEGEFAILGEGDRHIASFDPSLCESFAEHIFHLGRCSCASNLIECVFALEHYAWLCVSPCACQFVGCDFVASEQVDNSVGKCVCGRVVAHGFFDSVEQLAQLCMHGCRRGEGYEGSDEDANNVFLHSCFVVVVIMRLI